MDVRDKVALITGASAGIGLATARRLAAASSAPVDTPDYVAGKILQAIETEAAEQYMDR